MQLQQGRMSVLEYASKFMELSHFALSFVADKKLKMNRFERGLNLDLKERMSMRQYVSYKDLYDTTMNVKGQWRRKMNTTVSSGRMSRRGTREKISTLRASTRGLSRTTTTIATCVGASKPTTNLE